MEEAVIVSGVRTPFGSFGGSLVDMPAPTLGALVIEEALKRAGIAGDEVDEVLMGNVLQAGVGLSSARQSALEAGIPTEVPSLTINKACGSSLKTIALADQAIRAGDAEVLVAGGMESMSNAPYLLARARWGYRLGDAEMQDHMFRDGLVCSMAQCHMGGTAENVAVDFRIEREEMDEFAEGSQRKASKAWEEGRFAEEVVPVPVPQRRGDPVLFAKDEYIRADTSVDRLAKLTPAFMGEGGSVTAGNSSGINDGASATVVMSRSRAERLGLKPLGIIRGFGAAGVPPRVMGIGPIPATRKALQRAGLSMKDIDLIELNEAFAAQALAVGKELGWDWDRVNVNGGAIAIGHPVGASGARLAMTLLYEMERRRARYGLATMCIGGGMGVAMVFERPQ